MLKRIWKNAVLKEMINGGDIMECDNCKKTLTEFEVIACLGLCEACLKDNTNPLWRWS